MRCYRWRLSGVAPQLGGTAAKELLDLGHLGACTATFVALNAQVLYPEWV